MAGLFDGLGDPEAVARAFRNSPHITVVYEGPQHRITAVNEAMGAFFAGRPVLGLPLREAFGDVLGQGWGEVVDRVFETGEPFVAREWRIDVTLSDGSVHSSYVSAAFHRWEADGRSGVLGFASDVTEEVEARQRAEAASAASERRYLQARDLVLALQDSLLPGGLPVLPGLQTAGRYLLANHDTAAGGDWFDVIPRGDGRACLVVGDVVGHGVVASALMGQLRAVLTDRLASGETVSGALGALDRFAVALPEARATTVVVEVDPTSGRIEYCTAGHPPPLLIARGEPRFLAASGAGPLVSGRGFATITDQLEEDDVLLLYSDGIIERPGREPSRATAELALVAGRVVRGETLHEDTPVADRLCAQTLELLTRETGYSDDITLLAAHRVPAPAPLSLTVPAEAEQLVAVRAALGEWLAKLEVRDLDVLAVQHAVGEVVTNAVEHAYVEASGTLPGPPHTLEVTGELDPTGAAVLTVADHGRWRHGDRPEGGRGMAMVNGLIDHVRVTRDTGGTTVVLRHVMTRTVQLMNGSGSPAEHSGDEFGADAHGAVLTVRGAVDVLSAELLRQQLLRLTGGRQPRVWVDLSAVTLLASSGVQVLVDLAETTKRQGIDLHFSAEPGTVAQHVLDLVGMPYQPGLPDDAGS